MWLRVTVAIFFLTNTFVVWWRCVIMSIRHDVRFPLDSKLLRSNHVLLAFQSTNLVFYFILSERRSMNLISCSFIDRREIIWTMNVLWNDDLIIPYFPTVLSLLWWFIFSLKVFSMIKSIFSYRYLHTGNWWQLFYIRKHVVKLLKP